MGDLNCKLALIVVGNRAEAEQLHLRGSIPPASLVNTLELKDRFLDSKR